MKTTLTPEQLRLVSDLFEAAAEHPPAELEAWLRANCGGDEAVRAKVGQLLRAASGSDAFLETPLFPEPDKPLFSEEIIGRRVGPYQILREIGQGGMSTVYLAKRADAEFDQQVAVKIIWPGLPGSALLRRFRQERQILASLDHPNIARLLDGGTTSDGWPYLVMEYVDGKPITAYCDEHKLMVEERLRLFCDVCAAVEYAHQQAVIHCDLKPNNILVTPPADGHAGTVKLLDFGIAKLLKPDPHATAATTGLHALTPDYASPEQIRGEEATPGTDVYSLGVLLYELLTGVRPYRVKSLLPHEISKAICEVEPEPPSRRIAELARSHPLSLAAEPKKLRRQLAGDLDNITLKALRKEAVVRYQSVERLRQDVTRHLASEPVEARRLTLIYRTSRFARRYTALVTATALIMLSLIGGMIGAWLQMRRAEAMAQQNRQLLYAAQMGAAQQAWENANVNRVRELLAAQEPRFGQPDRRGWEWRYLWRLTHLERATLAAGGEVNAIAFSPDGRLLAIAGRDHIARLWVVETGREVFTLKGHTGILWTLAFSPDGRTLATGSSDRTIKLWEVETGRELMTLRGHAHTVRAIAFSPAGNLLAAGDDAGAVRLRATGTGREIAMLKGRDRIRSIAFSCDGRLLATGGDDALLALWDVAARRELFTLAGHEETIWAVAFAPDGRSLATGGEDETIRIWDLAARQARLVLSSHKGGVNAVAFSSDGGKLVTGSSDRTAQLRDAATGQILATLAGHGNRILAVAFSPDGRTVATGSADRTVKFWDFAALPDFASQGHGEETVWGLAFSPDSRTLATSGDDGTLKLWDTGGGQLRRAFVAGAVKLKAVAFSPDGQTIAAGLNDGAIRLWPVAGDGEPRTLKGHSARVRTVAFSPNNKILATAGEDNLVKLWDVASGKESFSLAGHTSQIMAVAFSPDGRLLATGADDNLVKLWDVAHRREVVSFSSHAEVVNTVAFSPDGRLLASGSGDGTVKLWDVQTRRELATLKGHVDRVWRVAFSPDGRRLATASSDKTIKLWEVATGLEIISIKVEAGVPRAVTFSPDGKWLALSGDHGVVKLLRAATETEMQARATGK